MNTLQEALHELQKPLTTINEENRIPKNFTEDDLLDVLDATEPHEDTIIFSSHVEGPIDDLTAPIEIMLSAIINKKAIDRLIAYDEFDENTDLSSLAIESLKEWAKIALGERFPKEVSEAIVNHSNSKTSDIDDFTDSSEEFTLSISVSKNTSDSNDNLKKIIDDLIKDENEAIEGYMKAISQIADNKEAIDVFNHIKNEEIEHIKELAVLLRDSEIK